MHPFPLRSCLYCKAPRPRDSSHQFCTDCGSQLPPLPDVDPTPPLQVAVCSQCRAHVPLDSASCVVCEHTVLHPSPIPLIHAQAKAQAKQMLQVSPGFNRVFTRDCCWGFNWGFTRDYWGFRDLLGITVDLLGITGDLLTRDCWDY